MPRGLSVCLCRAVCLSVSLSVWRARGLSVCLRRAVCLCILLSTHGVGVGVAIGVGVGLQRSHFCTFARSLGDEEW